MIHRETDIEQLELYIYPLTIIADRYTGAYTGLYSKGQFTAWNMYTDEIPKEVDMDDTTADEFWRNYKGIVGKGYTPDEALEDLHLQLSKSKKK